MVAYCFNHETAMPYLELNRESIATLVHTFYDDVRLDDVLGPVFNAAIGDHWETHLGRLVDFWCTAMLKTQPFQGNVFAKHMALAGIEPEHFRRWLTLFEATAARLFDPALAGEFTLVARRIAASLQFGFFGKVVVKDGQGGEAAA
ncbi:MAG: globin [Massilia sp.]|jgi:hemoglobin|nr:globin [Massilia sp.]